MDELAALPVLVQDNGARLVLGDVATIREEHDPPEERAYLDGAPAILLDIQRPRGTDALRALEALRGEVAITRRTLPPSLNVEIVQDTTSIVRDRLAMLIRNGAAGPGSGRAGDVAVLPAPVWRFGRRWDCRWRWPGRC